MDVFKYVYIFIVVGKAITVIKKKKKQIPTCLLMFSFYKCIRHHFLKQNYVKESFVIKSKAQNIAITIRPLEIMQVRNGKVFILLYKLKRDIYFVSFVSVNLMIELF